MGYYRGGGGFIEDSNNSLGLQSFMMENNPSPKNNINFDARVELPRIQ
jgi:hypothetical protein